MTDVNDWNEKIIAEFRANQGKVGGGFANNTLLLLHTKGAKSGLPRVNPLICIEEGDRLVVVASRGGAPRNPDWYYNLVANPNVEVEYGAERFTARAAVVKGPERSRLYSRMEDAFSTFTDYRLGTTRVIPVITLTRIG